METINVWELREIINDEYDSAPKAYYSSEELAKQNVINDNFIKKEYAVKVDNDYYCLASIDPIKIIGLDKRKLVLQNVLLKISDEELKALNVPTLIAGYPFLIWWYPALFSYYISKSEAKFEAKKNYFTEMFIYCRWAIEIEGKNYQLKSSQPIDLDDRLKNKREFSKKEILKMLSEEEIIALGLK
jgi:hypothetical protein